MNDDDIPRSLAGSTARRRRGGITGMVLAELRELARGLGVDTTGLRRGDLIAEIKKRQAVRAGAGSVTSGDRVSRVQVLRDEVLFIETDDVGEDARTEERVVLYVDESAEVTDQANVKVVEIEPVELTSDRDGAAQGDKDLAAVGPPPPARLLSVASLLLAPGERENWLGELRTTRWELRANPRGRRRETWGYFQALGKSFVTSWRYRGDGPTQEVS